MFFRLRLARALHRVAVATSCYVPLSALLLEMLQWPEVCKKPARACGKVDGGPPPELLLVIKASSTALAYPAFQEELFMQVVITRATRSNNDERCRCVFAFKEKLIALHVGVPQAPCSALTRQRFRCCNALQF